jgi:meiotically up-regulated gene 157 (Mug157) protein
MSKAIQTGIDCIGIFESRNYAFGVDGFNSYNIMDDVNIPSLLSAPLIGYTSIDDSIYQNRRRLIFSA